MKGKHAQKNFNAVGAMAPTPLALKTRGGGGGWGVSHTRTGPSRPPLLGYEISFSKLLSQNQTAAFPYPFPKYRSSKLQTNQIMQTLWIQRIQRSRKTQTIANAIAICTAPLPNNKSILHQILPWVTHKTMNSPMPLAEPSNPT